MQIVTVCCGKGGVGKTFSTLSLAVEFSIQSNFKKRILIVDLDPSIMATMRTCRDSPRNKTVADLLADADFDPKSAIYKASPNEYPSIHVLSGSPKLEFASQLVMERKNTENILKFSLKKIEKLYDLVLIDCPPNRGILVSNALVACHGYLTPMDVDDGSIDGVLGMTQLVKKLKKEGCIEVEPKHIGAFYTAFDKPNAKGTQLVITLAAEVLSNVLEIKVPSTSHVTEAIHYQSTLQFERQHKVAIAYQKLANHVINSINIGG